MMSGLDLAAAFAMFMFALHSVQGTWEGGYRKRQVENTQKD